MIPSVLRPALAACLCLALTTAAAAQWRPEGPAASVVNDVAFDPGDPNRVYAATAAGGVWRSVDGGRSWELPGGDLTNYTVEWVEVDPGNPATLWAGVDRPGNPAMFRSTDRGATWKLLTDATQGEGGRMHPVGQRIAFTPGKGTTIFVPSTNLHYRSDDGGKTWRDFRVPNQDAYTFAVHPTDAKIVLAGGRGESLNVSRSLDGGKTWKQTGIGLGQNSLSAIFFDPKDPKVVYAVAGTFGKIFKSTDGGDEFTQLTVPVGGTDDAFEVSMSPAGTLWAATEGGLLRSDDGGASWQQSDRGTGGYLVKSVAFHPRDPQRMLAGTGGTGVYLSTDGGSSWTESSQGLTAGWVEELYGREGLPGVFAQLSVGLFRFDGATSWTELREPFEDDEKAELDGMLFDRNQATVIFAHEGSSYWMSTDGGRRWQEPEKKEPSMRDMMRGNLATPEFKSMAQDAANFRTLYAGVWSSPDPGQAVWKTTDSGKTWKPAGAGLPEEAVQHLVSTAANTVLAVVDNEQLWRTTGGGSSWSQVGSGLPEEELRQVAADPGDPQRVFIATEKGLFRSTDGGGTFAKVGGALAEEDVEAVVADGKGNLYVGTFNGVFRSSDGGGTWTAMNDGLLNTDVRALAVSGSPARLFAGIAGGSVWSAPLP